MLAAQASPSHAARMRNITAMLTELRQLRHLQKARRVFQS
jgi:hypothetical protein